MKQRGRKSAMSLSVIPAAEPRRPAGDLPPPRALESSGLALWERITDAYDLSAGELEVLLVAAEAADVAEQVRESGGAVKDRLGALALCSRLLARLGVAP